MVQVSIRTIKDEWLQIMSLDIGENVHHTDLCTLSSHRQISFHNTARIVNVEQFCVFIAAYKKATTHMTSDTIKSSDLYDLNKNTFEDRNQIFVCLLWFFVLYVTFAITGPHRLAQIIPFNSIELRKLTIIAFTSNVLGTYVLVKSSQPHSNPSIRANTRTRAFILFPRESRYFELNQEHIYYPALAYLCAVRWPGFFGALRSSNLS